jgi:hypothetical protein
MRGILSHQSINWTILGSYGGLLHQGRNCRVWQFQEGAAQLEDLAFGGVSLDILV